MIIPDAAVNLILENVTQVLKYNYHLVADVRDNILSLQKELQTLRAQMRDFIRYNDDSEIVKDAVNQIRTIIGEAEDAVDSYLLQVAVQRARDRMSQVFHKLYDYPRVLREVGKQIENVGKEVKRISEGNLVRNGLDALKYQATVGTNRPGSSTEAPKVEEEHVIGFDGASKTVRELLTGGPEELEVNSIVGMLGLGKTTLARKVFKDPYVDYEFMLQSFVYVSKQYEKSEVLLKILADFKLISDDARKMKEEELEKHFYKQLEGKQYLVVLDDVWDIEDWKKFSTVFPKNNKRCRVLLTTRNDAVARSANPSKDPYKLNFLSLEDSQKLLRWKVFNEDKCFEEYKEHEINIVKKCCGLPLAIVVIAGIIVNHPDRVDWWRDVANSVRDYINNQDEVTKVMDLMYKHLPNHLKLCLLYLGVFGEDVEIPIWKLVRLWIAEGFIQQDGNLNPENLAEQYLEELVYRNLVRVEKRRSNDKIKTCRMHDTIRDFCKNEALKENLFQEINENNLSYFISKDPTLNLHRRLCINKNVLDYISSRPSGDRVRSFLTFLKKEEKAVVESKFVPCIPRAFKLLRVLEIESLSFTRFPADLSSLVLLRYIAISSNFSILPQALSILWNLQTLIVNTTEPKLDIQTDIWKMPQFRHFHTNASTNLPSPPGNTNQIGGQNVQTLSTISPESCRREVFERTPGLRKLGIRGAISTYVEDHGEASLFGYLRRLESLENLKLLNDASSKLHSFPSERSFPKQLTSLTLFNTQLDWEEMPTLGKLESLEVLELKQYAFKGILWKTQRGGFLRLKHLHIGRTDLVSWEASVDNFPKLRSLELNSCEQLEAFPHGLADILSLQSVVLHCTNTRVASSARKLHVLKLQQSNMGDKKEFKLSVYPPEH